MDAATESNLTGSPKRADGMPASREERQLRRLLCAAYEHMPYMDDGEAQGQTLDWMRCSVAEIQQRIRAINWFKYQETKKEIENGQQNL